MWEPDQEIVPDLLTGPSPVHFPKFDPVVTGPATELNTEVFRQALAWLKWGHDTYKGETQGKLFFHPLNKTWKFVPLPQNTPTPGQLTTKEVNNEARDLAINTMLTTGYTMLGSIHHHVDISAFQSGTDENDEVDKPGLHITVGRMNTDTADFDARFTHQGFFFNLPEDFETRYNLSLKELPSFPEEWKNVFVPPPPPPPPIHMPLPKKKRHGKNTINYYEEVETSYYDQYFTDPELPPTFCKLGWQNMDEDETAVCAELIQYIVDMDLTSIEELNNLVDISINDGPGTERLPTSVEDYIHTNGCLPLPIPDENLDGSTSQFIATLYPEAFFPRQTTINFGDLTPLLLTHLALTSYLYF